MEKLDYLIEYLLKENAEICINKMTTDINEKKNLYRSLCNIREAKPILRKYLQVENEYLQEELQKKDITKVEAIEPVSKVIAESNLENKDKIYLWQGDITTLKIDAIVNAANSQGLRLFCALP